MKFIYLIAGLLGLVASLFVAVTIFCLDDISCLGMVLLFICYCAGLAVAYYSVDAYRHLKGKL